MSRRSSGRRGLFVRAISATGLTFAVGLSLAACSSPSRTTASTSTTAAPAGSSTSSTGLLTQCVPSGCAVVNTVRTSPRVIVYSGASCAGPRGAWFLNATEGGPTNSMILTYRLTWDFGSSTTARPNGIIGVKPGGPATALLTLQNGVVKVQGRTAAGATVRATGTLSVRLTGTSAKPTLTVTETGLTKANQQLGIVSAFEFNGRPASLPVTSQAQYQSC